jgi:hypothetical protein
MRDIRAQFARTELELGFTFLHAASMLSDGKRAQNCVQDAIVALRTGNRFLEKNGDGDYADIWRRRDELRGRVREVMRAQIELARIGGRSVTLAELATRMRCSNCGKNVAEVVAVARPRPFGVPKTPD